MLYNTSRNRKLLGGVVGVNLALALAVSAGAVPRPGDNGSVRTAAVSQVEQVAPPAARQPGDAAAAPVKAAAATPAAAPAGPATTVAKPKVTAPPTTKAPVARTTATTAAPAAAVAPVATTTPAPVKVARRVPTAAEVQNVISELKRQVGGLLLLVSPTPAQIDQAGDQICSAFDAGQTLAQVKATGLSMIPASIVVAPATVDWAVRQAVTLYCPGHASKLV